MKNFKFLLGLLGVVMVMASCTTLQEAAGDDPNFDQRTQQVGNRLYLQDPYSGTVVLERDPYTGRYYDVTYGSRYGMGYGAYPYGGGVYRNRGYYGRNRGTVIQQPQRPTREQAPQNREEVRKKVLGN